MLHDVVKATYIGDYKIDVTFDDGQCGIVDFSSYLTKGGVFERFKDIEFFRKFSINTELGVLTWQNEIDIAPEILYTEATNAAHPNWVQASTVSS